MKASDDVYSVLRNRFCLPKGNRVEQEKRSEPCYIDAPTKQVYYRLCPSGTDDYLEFWIDTYANQRQKLHGKLRELIRNNQRDYCLLSYYSALGVRYRRPSTSVEDLRSDVEALRNLLKPIESEIVGHTRNSSSISVGIGNVSIVKLMESKLDIPDYQRAYCWGKENIIGLLEDVSRWQLSHQAKPYRVGTIILKEQKDGRYDVIDGQQRLITLALMAHQAKTVDMEMKAVDIRLGSTNQTRRSRTAIKGAMQIIDEWSRSHADVDLHLVSVGVVVIGEKESEDLSFNFFNHLNSSGVPLTDYELLKGHHLRYVKEDGVAKIMADRWHSLDVGEIEGYKERLLHCCLFRIRKWLANEEFPANADSLPTHVLFKEFSLDFEPLHGLCTSYKPVGINSLLSGGIEFFDYVNRFRQLFEAFSRQPAIKVIAPLKWHSHGTLYEVIFSLSFLFYCKFGDIYLNEAVYAIAWKVSSVRNGSQIRRACIGRSVEFREIAMLISRATHEGEVLGWLLNPLNVYSIENKGKTAKTYWEQLKQVGEELQEKSAKLSKEHRDFIASLTRSL